MWTGEDTPAAWKTNFNASRVVVVLVGREKQEFRVQQDLIFTCAPVIKTACDPVWKPDGGPVDLTNHDPDTFNAYVNAIYTGRIPERSTEVESVAGCLLRLYVLATYIQDLYIANKVIDELINHYRDTKTVPSASEIRYIYANTPPGAPLRRLVTDYHLYDSERETMEAINAQGMLPDFLLEFDQHTREYAVLQGRTERRESVEWPLGHPSAHPELTVAKHYWQHDPNDHVLCRCDKFLKDTSAAGAAARPSS